MGSCLPVERCERWIEVLGDPETDYAEMAEVSPVSRVADIRAPVMLGHGSDDRRVDIEHLYRMADMLEAHGRRYETYVIEGAGHSPDPEGFGRFMSWLRAFVLKSLAN